MSALHVGTEVELLVEVTDDRGTPTVPDAYTMWAKHALYGSYEIPCEIMYGQVRGLFTPSAPGNWTVAVEVSSPVKVTSSTSLQVKPLIPKP